MSYFDPNFVQAPTDKNLMADIRSQFKKSIIEGREEQKTRLKEVSAEIASINEKICRERESKFTPAQESILKRLRERKDELMSQKRSIREELRSFGHRAQKLDGELAANEKEINRLNAKAHFLSKRHNFFMRLFIRLFVGDKTTRTLKVLNATERAYTIREKAEIASQSLNQLKQSNDQKITSLHNQSMRLQKATQDRVEFTSSVHQASIELAENIKKHREQLTKYPKETREQVQKKLGDLKAQLTSLKTLEYQLGKTPLETDASMPDKETAYLSNAQNAFKDILQQVKAFEAEVEQVMSNATVKNPKTVGQRMQEALSRWVSKPKPVDQGELKGEIEIYDSPTTLKYNLHPMLSRAETLVLYAKSEGIRSDVIDEIERVREEIYKLGITPNGPPDEIERAINGPQINILDKLAARLNSCSNLLALEKRVREEENAPPIVLNSLKAQNIHFNMLLRAKTPPPSSVESKQIEISEELSQEAIALDARADSIMGYFMETLLPNYQFTNDELMVSLMQSREELDQAILNQIDPAPLMARITLLCELLELKKKIFNTDPEMRAGLQNQFDFKLKNIK